MQEETIDAPPVPAAPLNGDSGMSGIFDSLATAESKVVAEPAGQEGDEGASQPGQTDQNGVQKTPASQSPRVYAQRFKTPEELETAYFASSKEGRRLNSVLREVMAERNQLKADLEAAKLQASAPAFKELSKEELQEMARDNPLAAQEYLIEKRMREYKLENQKTEQAKLSQEREREKANLESHIIRRSDQMSADSDNFPEYIALIPVMDEIMDKVPDVVGHSWTPEVLYFMAYGIKSLQALKQSKKLSDAERQRAARIASASSQAIGGSGTGSTGNDHLPNDDSDESFNKRLLAKAPKSLFG